MSEQTNERAREHTYERKRERGRERALQAELNEMKWNEQRSAKTEKSTSEMKLYCMF